MTKIFFALVLIFSTNAFACEDKAEKIAEKKTPPWLKKKLKSSEPPIEVEKYIFKNETTYLLAYVCCDQGTRELYDAKGKLICKLPESFAGLDDSECPGFNKDAKHVGSVLKKH